MKHQSEFARPSFVTAALSGAAVAAILCGYLAGMLIG